MKVSYQLTVDDLATFVNFHNVQSPAASNQRLGCWVVGFGSMFLLPGLMFLTSEKPFLETAGNIWPLLMGPIIFLLFAFPVFRMRFSNFSKQILNEGENAGFYGDSSISLNADGIRESKESGDTIRKWSAVEKIIIAPEYLYIYTSGIEAFVVPRRAFTSESDFKAFAQHAADHSDVSVQNA